MKEMNKLNGKDLINIGIYTAIYFVVIMVIAFTGLIPIMLILMSSMVGLIGGIPFMLFLTKVEKPGMILIMSLLMGILAFLTGMTWVPVLFSLVTGLISEIVYKSGNYKSAKAAVLTAGVFPLWCGGNYLPLFVNREEYFASRQSYGEEYVSVVMSLTPNWMFFVLLVLTVIFGILGGVLGSKLLKKHFEKAGIV